MRLIVWETDDARWPRIRSVVLECGAQCERLSHSNLGTAGDYDAAIVSLENARDEPDASLRMVSQFHAAGLGVIAHGSNVTDWPVRDKCRALLAGAGTLIENGKDFERSLHAGVQSLLSAWQRRRDDERRTRELAHAQGIVGQSSKLMDAFRRVLQLSPLSDLPVLVCGESGTGKELFAKALHALDPKRRHRDLVAINCAAINAHTAESELFGHARGAFTGAASDHAGLFDVADGGVLFLDEIGELNLELQAKLLRVLQEKRLRRLGASKDSPIDVRVIAATNQDLPLMIREGRFRNDLFHRLNTLCIHISPLRERPSDLPALIDHFIQQHDPNACERRIDKDYIDAISRLTLFGNVRELRNLVTASLAMKTDASALGLKDLPPDVWLELLQSGSVKATMTTDVHPQSSMQFLANRIGEQWEWNLEKCLSEFEREIVQAAMFQTRNNQSQAARLLGLTPRSVYNKIRKHKLLDRLGN